MELRFRFRTAHSTSAFSWTCCTIPRTLRFCCGKRQGSVVRSLLKDHLDENFVDNVTLRLMDWLGNRPHGVVLTYNYQSRTEWAKYFSSCGLAETTWTTRVPIYPAPVSFFAGRGLHFVSLLKKVK